MREEPNEAFPLPVDLIRVFAIILVIMLHVSNAFYFTFYQAPFNAASWWTFTVYKSVSLPCVPLFVILSGALLLQPSKLNEPVKVFLKKRLSRIGLAFVFWSFVYLAWGFAINDFPITLNNVIQGWLMGWFEGPYYHFWFLYVIFGLYLITPLLRAIMASKPKLLGYLILLWFLGVAVVPLFPFLVGYSLNSSVFVIGGYVGYFVLGVYLKKVRFRPALLYGFIVLGVLLTVGCTWLMNFPLHALGQNNFFFDYLTINVIMASVALFMFLSKFPADWPSSNHRYAKKLVQAISNNTLPIYLFHVLILEALQIGIFGFAVNLAVDPIIQIPIVTVVVLFITTGLVLVMKKVPILRKLIG
jgi:surface polysaccharide O-acyltransferase-like enzyme